MVKPEIIRVPHAGDLATHDPLAPQHVWSHVRWGGDPAEACPVKNHSARSNSKDSGCDQVGLHRGRDVE